MDPTEPDSTTSAPWLQRLQALFLAGLVVYFAVGFSMPFERAPAWSVPGVWQMFTLRDPIGADLVAEIRRPGAVDWERIDLPALFPTRWGSGYRYSRTSFRRSEGRMRILGASTCLRLPERPTEVRFTEVRWRKVLGSTERGNVKERVVLTHDCATRVRLPGGRFLPDDAVAR